MYYSYNPVTESINVIVQMDETKIKKWKHNRDFVIYDNWIFDNFERDYSVQ